MLYAYKYIYYSSELEISYYEAGAYHELETFSQTNLSNKSKFYKDPYPCIKIDVYLYVAYKVVLNWYQTLHIHSSIFKKCSFLFF